MFIELQNIAKRIIESQNKTQEFSAVRLLNDFYLRLGTEHFPGQTEEIVLNGGIALSTHHAATCLLDLTRTAKFIKGIHAACLDLLDRFSSQKIHILYAGCGPYGTLLLPVLSLFDSTYFQVTFLDCNEHSIRQMKQTLKKIGFSDYDLKTVVEDAIHYQYPNGENLHLVISETMFHGLMREPQVAITANLAPQICEGGILVPEHIELVLCAGKYTEVPFIEPDMSYRNGKIVTPKAINMGKILSIDLKNNHHETGKAGISEIVSPVFEVKNDLKEFPDFYVQTSVTVYKNHQLLPAESTITNAYCIGNYTLLSDKKRFRVSYHFKNQPQWKLSIFDSKF